MEFRKLGEFCTVKGGKRLPKGTQLQKSKTNHPYLRIKDFNNGNIDINNLMYISEEIFNEISNYTINKGNIFLSIVGTIGLVDVIEEELDKSSLTENAVKIYSNDEKQLSTEFLSYYLKSTMGQHEISIRTVGSTQPKLAITRIKDINVPMIDIKKQYKITWILSNIDKKIKLNRTIIANLEELSQTLFKRWFVDFEFPDENGNPYKSSGGEMIDSELGEIPSGWKVDELGNYIKIKSGKRPKNKVDKKDIENVVPIIGASKIMGYTNDYLYNEKIIIIGRVGTHGVIQRFSTRTWPSDNTFVIISDFESIIYQVLKSIDYISLNRGSTQPLLSQKDIKNTKVAMPTNETLLSTYQKENNHILKMMDQKNIENQKLTQLRDTLLPKLMSGEIEIPDDIEVNEDELSI